jgi:FixJ family two-component response regulator
VTGSRGKVLVVEDDDSMRLSIERLLNAADFDTTVYRSAEALLAAGPGEGVDCVVSDLKLETMTGLQLLVELRERGWQRPLILVTAHDTDAVRFQAEQLGVAAFLAKPFIGSALLAAIRAVLAPQPLPA